MPQEEKSNSLLPAAGFAALKGVYLLAVLGVPAVMFVATSSQMRRRVLLLYFSMFWLFGLVSMILPNPKSVIGLVVRSLWAVWAYHPKTNGALVLYDGLREKLLPTISGLMGLKTAIRKELELLLHTWLAEMRSKRGVAARGPAQDPAATSQLADLAELR